MTKKVKGSLFAKVFLITTVMLLCISLLVFAMLAWLMPQTYTNKLNTILDERAQGFVYQEPRKVCVKRIKDILSVKNGSRKKLD